MCQVYVGMHTSRLDDMMMSHVSTRFSFLVWYRDDEWCWESRLDFMRIWVSRLEKYIKSRLEKMCGFSDFYARDVDKSPVLCYARLVHNTLAHFIQILYGFYTDYKTI